LTDVNILLVDDHPSNLFALESILDGMGYNLVKVQSGAEALKCLLKEREFAAVLLDVQMPLMDGFETAALIRERERLRHLPIIFVTAYQRNEEHLFKGYSLGAVDYIFKPIIPEILRAKVAVLADLYLKTQEVKQQAEQLRQIELKEHERRLHEATYRVREEFLKREKVLEQERLRFFTLSADMLCIADLEGMIKQPNPAHERILGFASTELIGQPYIEFIHPMDRPSVRSEMRKLKSSGDTISFEAQCRCKDGSYKWIAWTARAFPEDKSFYAVGRDISARKQTEEELNAVREELAQQLADMTRLHELSARLSTTLELQPTYGEVLKAVVDLQAASAGVLLVYDADKGEFKPAAGLGVESAAVPASGAYLGRAVSERRRILIEESEMKESGESWLAQARKEGFRAVHGIPIFTREGDCLGVLLTYFRQPYGPSERDTKQVELYANVATHIIDNARLFRKAREAIGVREQFISIASHELKTPLTALQLQIQSMIRSMKKEDPDHPLARRLASMLDSTYQQGTRLAGLINNLLDVSRMTAGKLQVDPEEIDVAAVVRLVADRFKEELTQSGCDLRLKAPETARGTFDRLRLEQVVTNLLSNAIKYGKGKPVELTLEPTPGGLRLLVRDFGIGISPEFQKKIFAPFERGVPTNNYGGLGLGLYITKQILEAHGASIRVASDVGKGTTFLVDLPGKVAANSELAHKTA
jgi:PAS domain S-box-containing protein